MIVAPLLFLAQSPKLLADLPFEYAPGRIWLKATLNNQPVSVMLDTGANRSFVDQDVARKLGATKLGESRTSSVGGTGTSWAVKGLALKLDGTSIFFEPSFAAKLPAMPGRDAWLGLGVDFISKYVVEIDYAAKRLRLYDPEGFPAPADHVPMRLTFLGGCATFRGRLQLPGLEERRLNVLFDTGSPMGFALTNRVVLAEGLDARFADAPRMSLPGPLGGGFRVALVKDSLFSLSTATIKGEAGLVLSPEGGLGKDAAFDALMGDQVFRQMHVVLDYSRSRMYLKRPS